ncbi:MAG: hypothetical protein AB7V06_28280 [Candidatus Obscuribacterales bacterium]
MPTGNEPLQDDDDDDQDQPSTITFLTDGTWTTHDLQLLAASVSQIYDARLATLLWTRRLIDDVENRRRLLKKAFRDPKKRMPAPFFHEWYEVWTELLEKGELPVLPLGAPFPFVIQSDFPTPVQIYQALDLYADTSERCIILRAQMSSPGGFSFTGLGEIVKEFRELVKDLSYRNSQEKRKGELEIKKLEVDLADKYLGLREHLTSSHGLTTTVEQGLRGLIELERNGKLRPISEHIDHSGDL